MKISSIKNRIWNPRKVHSLKRASRLGMTTQTILKEGLQMSTTKKGINPAMVGECELLL